MLNKRDKDLLRFLEINKSITLQQATILFFNGLYVSACRRLKQLEQRGHLHPYISEYNKNVAYYYDQRPLSPHDLIVLDFYCELIKVGAKIIKFKACFQNDNGLSYLNGMVKPDAYFEFDYRKNDGLYTYYMFLEVDYTHFTNKDKITMYKKMFRDEVMNDECDGEFPIILILRPTENDYRYQTDELNLIYADMDLKNVNLRKIFN